MHGFLDELDQAFFTFQLGGLPLDFQIEISRFKPHEASFGWQRRWR